MTTIRELTQTTVNRALSKHKDSQGSTDHHHGAEGSYGPTEPMTDGGRQPKGPQLPPGYDDWEAGQAAGNSQPGSDDFGAGQDRQPDPDGAQDWWTDEERDPVTGLEPTADPNETGGNGADFVGQDLPGPDEVEVGGQPKAPGASPDGARSYDQPAAGSGGREPQYTIGEDRESQYTIGEDQPIPPETQEPNASEVDGPPGGDADLPPGLSGNPPQAARDRYPGSETPVPQGDPTDASRRRESGMESGKHGPQDKSVPGGMSRSLDRGDTGNYGQRSLSKSEMTERGLDA